MCSILPKQYCRCDFMCVHWRCWVRNKVVVRKPGWTVQMFYHTSVLRHKRSDTHRDMFFMTFYLHSQYYTLKTKQYQCLNATSTETQRLYKNNIISSGCCGNGMVNRCWSYYTHKKHIIPSRDNKVRTTSIYQNITTHYVRLTTTVRLKIWEII